MPPVQHTYSLSGSDGAALPPDTQVVGFRGSEGISRPYRIEIYFLVAEAELAAFDPRSLLGQRASLRVHRDDGELRRVLHGAWSSVSLLRAASDGRGLYRAVLAPALWRLSLAHRSRVFVRQTVPAIVETVLRGAGLTEQDFIFELDNPDRYLPLEHVCQYRETDLDFVARHLEHDGLYYFFQHGPDGAREKLVITDSAAFLGPFDQSPVAFLPLGPDGEIGPSEEGLRSLACEYVATSAGARVFGYNPLSPAAPLFGEVPNGTPGERGRTTWGPARTEAESGDDMERLALLRDGEINSAQTVVEGEGRAFGISAGFSFRVVDHALLDGEYLATEASFQGCDFTAHRQLARLLGFGEQVFELAFKAIPAAVQFRPARVTPRPRVHGFELGVVKGPLTSDYAQVDEHGRYLVEMKFEGGRDAPGAPSTRIRMLQPHGGPNGMGFHFPLRNGTEVLVSFVGGDPDAPVIAGVAPNAETPSPVTAANNTKNVVHTGGGSRLEIEDQAGAEAVDWSTPYNRTSFHLGAPREALPYEVAHRSDGSGQVHMGGRWDVDIASDRTEFVGGKVWEHYGANPPARAPATTPGERRNTTVVGAQKTTVTQLVTEQYQAGHVTIVGGDRDRVVHGNLDEQVDGDAHRAYRRDLSEDVTRDVSQVVHGSATHDVSGSVTRSYRGDCNDTVSGTWTVNAAVVDQTVATKSGLTTGNEANLNAGAKFDLYMGAQLAISLGLKMETFLGGTMSIMVGPKIDLHAGLKVDAHAGLKIEQTEGAEVKWSESSIENRLLKIIL